MTERIAKRYAPFDQLACGGMATVHLGVDLGASLEAPPRPVAMKRLHSQHARDPEFVRMLRDEARLVSHIDHPNVVKLIEIVANPDEVVLVLEYVAGETLLNLVCASRARLATIPTPVAVAIVCSLLRGLAAAHEARDEAGAALAIVHRDVSPHNVMLTGDGHVRLIDFGVAKAAGRLHTTREKSLKGKLPYMAPEQVRGTGVSAATDVYAASVVLWELLTLRRLFKGENEATILEQVLLGYVDPPSRFAPATPQALDRVVLRGVATDQKARFATASEMVSALALAVAPASNAEVAAWVRELAGGRLDERAAKVASALASARETSRATYGRRRARAVAIGGVVGVTAALALAALSSGRLDAAADRGALAARASSVSANVVATEPLASVKTTEDHVDDDVVMELPASEDETSLALAGAVDVDLSVGVGAGSGAPTNASLRGRATKAARAHHAPRAGTECTLPYTRDAAGRKVYKVECLRP